VNLLLACWILAATYALTIHFHRKQIILRALLLWRIMNSLHLNNSRPWLFIIINGHFGVHSIMERLMNDLPRLCLWLFMLVQAQGLETIVSASHARLRSIYYPFFKWLIAKFIFDLLVLIFLSGPVDRYLRLNTTVVVLVVTPQRFVIFICPSFIYDWSIHAQLRCPWRFRDRDIELWILWCIHPDGWFIWMFIHYAVFLFNRFNFFLVFYIFVRI